MPVPRRGTVVITGASTGIGEACALHLDRLGFQVFAGVRKQTDGDALKSRASDRLTPLLLDVCDAESIAAARDVVAAAVGDEGLAALVNNAGISVNAPLEFIPLDKLRLQMEVNVIGLIAATQAFLELLRKAQGRVVNIGSTSGRLAIPMGGPYCASKFAVEALSDSMRMELRPWNIEVVLVEPGAIATPIWEKSMAAGNALLESLPARMTELYAPLIDKIMKGATQSAKSAAPPQVIADAVEHALTASRPKTRYLAGKDARIQMLLTHLPDRWRDALILKMLDKAI